MRDAARWAGIAGILLTGCSSSSSSDTSSSHAFLDADSFCNAYVTMCGGAGTVSSCLETARAVRVSQSCADKMKSATCDDLLGKGASGAALNDLCFPACTKTSTATCESDSQALDSCGSDGRLKVFDCTKSCAATGGSTGSPNYSGTCGTAYKGQSSAQSICWCTK
jgi:hypothetical protein